MDSSDVNIAIRIWSKPYSIDKVKTIHGKEFSLINLYTFMGDFYFVLQIVMLSDIAAKTAPIAHTPIQPSCVQANPAQ